ncbi:hypothetical protein V4890_17765 [Ralstonia solanacearum species complex bacterium KE056]|uniref:hypothetical protein n=1 Tax=Ralstonia solanacearum species complex bacterium KE056 TaxID=3119585 RepID=UPI002FC27D51
MDIQHVVDALNYFVEYQPLLGVEFSNDFDECVLLASDEARLQFVDAMLDAIVVGHSRVPERVALGGLRAIVDSSATMLPYSLFAEGVPSHLRTAVLTKMHAVFVEIFPQRCERLLAHRAAAPLPPWNLLCFMWWELLPRHGVPPVTFLAETDLTILQLMGSVLKVDHVACKEAALHGLALWQAARPGDVQGLIDRYAAYIPETLQDYALAAKTGSIQ